MQYARTTGGELAEAISGAEAVCPCCGSSVVPKCGEIVVHHWAHEARADCDRWSEPESPWHRKWKSYAAPERREVVIGDHRADVQRSNGVVVELQHSSISVAEIAEREAHYQRMVWLFDANELAYREGGGWRNCSDRTGLILGERLIGQGPHARQYRWKHARWTWLSCKAPIYLDLGRGWIFRLRGWHDRRGIHVWGELRHTLDFAHWLSEGRTTAIKRPSGTERIDETGAAKFYPKLAVVAEAGAS